MEKAITRKEQYLTAIAEGDTTKMPEKPLTREEVLLEKIAKKPSTAVDPSVITDAVNDYLDEHPVSAKTAYEQAVDGGYTGTKAEFEQALANIDTVADINTQLSNIQNGILTEVTEYVLKPTYDSNKKYYYYDEFLTPPLKDAFYVVEIETKNINFDNGMTSFALQWQKPNEVREDIYRIKYTDINASGGTHVDVPNVSTKVITHDLDLQYEKIRAVIQSYNANSEVKFKIYEYTAKGQRFLKDVNSAKNLHLYAHRGYTPEAPENSIPAFELAGKYGYWGCETDVFKTQDNVLVCMHDETIDRMTNGTGNIADMTYSQLQTYVIDTGNNVSNYTQEELRIPTFEDYLKICKKWDLVPFVEIKEGIVDYVMPIIIEYGLENVAIVSSSDFKSLYQCRKYCDIFIHYIRYTTTTALNDSYIDYISKIGNGGLNFDTSGGYVVTDAKVKELNNKKVAFCERAGDTVESIIDMLELGCAYIPTNSVKPADVITTLFE